MNHLFTRATLLAVMEAHRRLPAHLKGIGVRRLRPCGSPSWYRCQPAPGELQAARARNGVGRPPRHA